MSKSKSEEQFDMEVVHALKHALLPYGCDVRSQFSGSKAKKATPLEHALAHATKNKGFSPHKIKVGQNDEKITQKSINKIIDEKNDAINVKYQRKYRYRSIGKLDVSVIIKSKKRTYLVIIEDKTSPRDMFQQGHNNDLVNLNAYYTMTKAVNGAVYYARCVSKYKKAHPNNAIPTCIFAIGCTPSKDGELDKMYMDPYFIDMDGTLKHTTRMSSKNMDKDKIFNFLKPSNIDDYYNSKIHHGNTQKEIAKPDVKKLANNLNYYMYSLGIKDDNKAPLVASVLLGIKSFYNLHKDGDILKELGGLSDKTHKDKDSDGHKLVSWIDSYLSEKDIDSTEVHQIYMSFAHILVDHKFEINKRSEIRVTKNSKQEQLTPIGHMVGMLLPVFEYMTRYNEGDILGHFYSHFVKYNNNNGNNLGIVITPERITKIMALLLEKNGGKFTSHTKVLDPVAGTGTFLVTAMQQMLKNDQTHKSQILSNCLFGIENDPDMYAVLVANMILRGDGQSNLHFGDFFKCQSKNTVSFDKNEIKENLQKISKIKKHGLKKENGKYDHKKHSNIINQLEYVNSEISKQMDNYDKELVSPDYILMNPPYSLAKKEKSKGKPEIDFIVHALKILKPGGLLAAIIPQSVFVSGGSGVSKSYAELKKYWILEHCTVLDVITMNPDTFYPIGTQPVIIVIKKEEAKSSYYSNLIDFSHDGYEVIPKQGVVPKPINKDLTYHILGDKRNLIKHNFYKKIINIANNQSTKTISNIKDACHVLNITLSNILKRLISMLNQSASKLDRESKLSNLYLYSKDSATDTSIQNESYDDKRFLGPVKCIHVMLKASSQDLSRQYRVSTQDKALSNCSYHDLWLNVNQRTPFIQRCSFEWIFGANYTIPTLPSVKDFEDVVEDYLGFKSSQILKGHKYLFEKSNNKKGMSHRK